MAGGGGCGRLARFARLACERAFRFRLWVWENDRGRSFPVAATLSDAFGVRLCAMGWDVFLLGRPNFDDVSEGGRCFASTDART